MNLYTLTTEYTQAFLALAESNYDQQTIEDTLAGLEGELVAKGQNVLAYALNLDAEAAALKEMETRIAKRRKSKELQAEHMRNYLKRNMAMAGITEIRALDNSFVATLQIGRDTAVIIDNSRDVAGDLCRHIPESWEPDKAAIKKAIEAGEEVEGAHLVHNDRLVIK